MTGGNCIAHPQISNLIPPALLFFSQSHKIIHLSHRHQTILLNLSPDLPTHQYKIKNQGMQDPGLGWGMGET